MAHGRWTGSPRSAGSGGTRTDAHRSTSPQPPQPNPEPDVPDLPPGDDEDHVPSNERDAEEHRPGHAAAALRRVRRQRNGDRLTVVH